jgi:hypothetical protein
MRALAPSVTSALATQSKAAIYKGGRKFGPSIGAFRIAP